MFDCYRCKNTGRVLEQCYETPNMVVPCPLPAHVMPADIEIKTRERECPECLGFSAVPLRPRGSNFTSGDQHG